MQSGTPKDSKIILKEKQIFEYMNCPLRYSMKYNSNLPQADKISIPALLEPIIQGFCLNLVNGNVHSPAWLKMRWDKCCKKYPGFLKQDKVIRGISLLVNMFNYCKENALQVVDICSPYEIYTDLAVVRGQLGCIAMTKNKFELVIFDAGQKSPTQTTVDMDLKITLQCLAFKTIFSESLSGVRIIHLHTKSTFNTYRVKDDYLRLRIIIDNISTCIKNKLFYPRINVLCPSCPQLMLCKSWII